MASNDWSEELLAAFPIRDDAFAAAMLGRPGLAVVPAEFARSLSGRRVLVTGAGGFIGSGIVRLLATLGVSRIVMLDHGEYNLYAVDRMMAEERPEVPRRALYCDIRDARALHRHFTEERPEIVFHAAALKQLPLLETNAREAALSNIFGTLNVAEAAAASGAAAMVAISSDKAVNPASVLGATKRLAEAVCQAMDLQRGATRFVSVRFGNVFGSTGSVVPLFARQIAEGGPVTLTDPRMTRYFLTIAEAASLVSCALTLALEDERHRGAIYLLDTGEAVRIADLAERMIAHGGKTGIAIEVIGPRPGERLTEQLIREDEPVERVALRNIWRSSPECPPLERLRTELEVLRRACDAVDEQAVRQWLAPHFDEVVGAPVSRLAV